MTERARPSAPHDNSGSSTSSGGVVGRFRCEYMVCRISCVSAILWDEGEMSDYDDKLAGIRKKY